MHDNITHMHTILHSFTGKGCVKDMPWSEAHEAFAKHDFFGTACIVMFGVFMPSLL